MWIRYVNRIFWELLRFTLPLVPFLLVTSGSIDGAGRRSGFVPGLSFWRRASVDFGVIAALCVFGLVLKWALMGRVKPAVHSLWSFWVTRWEFHYITWDLYVAGPLSALEGTLLMNWFLRLMGAGLDGNVMLGSASPSSSTTRHARVPGRRDRNLHVPGPHLSRTACSRSTTSSFARKPASARAVLLYGADIGERTIVSPHSVVMKHERLLPDANTPVCPTQLTA